MLKPIATIVCVLLLSIPGTSYADAAQPSSTSTRVWESAESLARARDHFLQTGVLKRDNAVAVEDFTNDLYEKARQRGLLPADNLGEEFEAVWRQKLLEINRLQSSGTYLTWQQVEFAQQRIGGIALPTAADSQAMLRTLQPAVVSETLTPQPAQYRPTESPSARQSDLPAPGEVVMMSEAEIAELRSKIAAAQASGNGAQTTANSALSLATTNKGEITKLDTRLSALEATVNGVEGDDQNLGLAATVALQQTTLFGVKGDDEQPGLVATVGSIANSATTLADKVTDLGPRVESNEKALIGTQEQPGLLAKIQTLFDRTVWMGGAVIFLFIIIALLLLSSFSHGRQLNEFREDAPKPPKRPPTGSKGGEPTRSTSPPAPAKAAPPVRAEAEPAAT